MKTFHFLILLCGILTLPAQAQEIQINTGTITILHSNLDEGKNIYFKLNGQTISQYFLLKGSSRIGLWNGCDYVGDDVSYDTFLSLILTAKASNKTVDVRFCKDTNDYGIISVGQGYFRILD